MYSSRSRSTRRCRLVVIFPRRSHSTVLRHATLIRHVWALQRAREAQGMSVDCTRKLRAGESPLGSVDTMANFVAWGGFPRERKP